MMGASASRASKRALFVREYLIDRNATQAAIRAGYSPKTASAAGSRLLRDVKVSAEIEAISAADLHRLDITRERLMEELARIAFSNVDEYVTWGMRERTHFDRSGNAHTESIACVEIIESADVDPDACRAISEITQSRHGLKIKLHDKLAAIRLLGLALGMFKEKTENDFADPLRAIVEAVQRKAAPLPINDPNAGRVLRASH